MQSVPNPTHWPPLLYMNWIQCMHNRCASLQAEDVSDAPVSAEEVCAWFNRGGQLDEECIATLQARRQLLGVL